MQAYYEKEVDIEAENKEQALQVIKIAEKELKNYKKNQIEW